MFQTKLLLITTIVIDRGESNVVDIRVTLNIDHSRANEQVALERTNINKNNWTNYIFILRGNS